MAGFWQKLFGRGDSVAEPGPAPREAAKADQAPAAATFAGIAPEKVSQIIDWSMASSIAGQGLANFSLPDLFGDGFGRNLSVEWPKDGSDAGEISFALNPRFAFLKPTHDSVEVRYTEDGPLGEKRLVTDPETLAKFDALLDFWHHELDIPQSIDKHRLNKRRTGSRHLLHAMRAVLKGDPEGLLVGKPGTRDHYALHVARDLPPQELPFRIAKHLASREPNGEIEGDVMRIDYEGRSVHVEIGATERLLDATMIALNQLLIPDYEIRHWLGWKGDVQAFLLLRSKQWKDLETEHGAEIGRRLRKIEPGGVYFGT